MQRGHGLRTGSMKIRLTKNNFNFLKLTAIAINHYHLYTLYQSGEKHLSHDSHAYWCIAIVDLTKVRLTGLPNHGARYTQPNQKGGWNNWYWCHCSRDGNSATATLKENGQQWNSSKYAPENVVTPVFSRPLKKVPKIRPSNHWLVRSKGGWIRESSLYL